MQARPGPHTAIAPSWSRPASQSQTQAGDETSRQCPNRDQGRGTLPCPQEGGQRCVPMAPAVPLIDVQYLQGSQLGMPGRMTPTTPPAGRELSTTKQPEQARGTLLAEGTWRGWPLCLPACGVLLPSKSAQTKHLPPSRTAALPLQPVPVPMPKPRAIFALVF